MAFLEQFRQVPACGSTTPLKRWARAVSPEVAAPPAGCWEPVRSRPALQEPRSRSPLRLDALATC